jgi:predicted dehydrogenase
MVGHTFLFNNTVRTIKKLIDDGELGEIRYIYSQRVNLGRIRSDVDALWNLASHDISIIQGDYAFFGPSVKFTWLCLKT